MTPTCAMMLRYGPTIAGKRYPSAPGTQASEQRRTEHDSRENFADDRRLIGAAEDPAHRARGRDHHHQREQHVQQVAFVGARRGRAEDVAPRREQVRRACRRTTNPQIQQHQRADHQCVNGDGARAGGGNSRLSFSHWRILPECELDAQRKQNQRGHSVDERLAKIGGRFRCARARFLFGALAGSRDDGPVAIR